MYKYLLLSLITILINPEINAQTGRNDNTYLPASPDIIDPLGIASEDFSPPDLQLARITADLLFSTGNFDEAARNYLFLVFYNRDDCESYFRLASCYSMMGENKLAMDFLVMAVNTGYNSTGDIRESGSLENLCKDPYYKEKIDELELYQSMHTGKLHYFKASSLLKCRVFIPRDYNKNTDYTLVIGLHGNGGNAMNFSGLWKEIDNGRIIYAVPESPYNYSNNGGSLTQQYTWGIPSRDKILWERSDSLTCSYIKDVALELNKIYNIKNTVLMGFSQGASFAYATAIMHYPVFNGLVCFGGQLPSSDKYPWFLEKSKLQQNTGLPVYICHGINDRTICISKAKESQRELKKIGYKVRFREFEGGHYVPGKLFREAISWLNRQYSK